MASLIQKAWDLYRQTECFPVTTILKAARWLETKHRAHPDLDTAVVIALHYLVLALREEAERNGALFEIYLSEAMHWRDEGIRQLTARNADLENKEDNEWMH